MNAAGAPEAQGRRPRPAILIVDDNENKRTALKLVLQPLEYSIVEADSGIAALRCVTAQDFAVILLDVQMPHMDGFETAALIRLRQQSELTPIIFVTSYEIDEISTDRYAEGAVDFMFAPFKPDELRAKVTVFGNMFANTEVLATRAREAQMTADQLRLLTDSAPIGIFQTDADNRYVYTNPQWAEIVGMPSEQAAGQRWDVILRADQRDALAPDAAVAGGGLGHRFEVEVPGAGSRVVLVTSRAVHDGAGVATGWVGTVADVTTEVGAESAMADAVAKATEASRLKSDFLANMSHEIRTPMNGVLGMTDLLLETQLDARQRDYAQTVRNSGEALLTIINDILDFSKVEAGMLEVEDVRYDVRAVVHDVVDLLATPAQAKGIELTALVDGSVPAVVSGDPGRLRQVLTNLVGNALKFTQDGQVGVCVGVVQVPGGCELRFEVTDTGDGVPADKLDLIFEPFAQGDTSTARRYGGTGLGLAISSQLVGLMGGGCGVSSRPGVGSTFWFTVRVRSEPGQAVHGMLRRDPDLAGLPVLVVDGNAVSRAALSQHLQAWGLDVTTADTAPSALALLRGAAGQGRPPTIALVDRSVVGEDGPALLDLLVGDPAAGVRLVLMTGLGGGDLRSVGVCATLSKPVHPEDLRRCLRVAAGLDAADVVDVVVPDGRPHGAVGLTGGRLLLVEDNLINQKVALEMLTSAGYQVDVAPHGAAAVEAVRARRYGAVLMDCQMPEMNGYEATAAIRAAEGEGPRTPIIAMTAGARTEDRDRCLAAGMDGYLSKPVSKPVLTAKVAQFFTTEGTAGSGAPVPRQAGPTTRGTGGSAIDPAVVAELRALAGDDDPDFFALLVEDFVSHTDTGLERLGDALRSGDAREAGRIAHSIKGSSGSMGGHRLALACARLEQVALAGHPAECLAELVEVQVEYDELRRALEQELAPPG